MQTYSAFQQTNPLSPRKFTKKIIGPIISWAIMSVIFVGIGGLTVWFSNGLAQLNSWSGKFSIAGFAFFTLILLIKVFYFKAYIKRYYYDAGDQFVTIKKGVFAPTEIHVQYAKIQDVYVDQDLTDRILGLFDVHIASATVTSGIEAHIDGVDKETAERIKNFFLGKIGSSNSSQSGASMVDPNPATPSVHLTSEISSITYPPSPKYLWSSFFSAIVVALVLSFIAWIKLETTLMVSIFWFIPILVVMQTYNVIWFKNYYFFFDKDMIIKRTKVIGTNETHVPYHTIQDVVFNQGILDRVLGIASVTIQNATQTYVGRNGGSIPSGITLIAQPTEKAKELVEVVRGIMGKGQASRTGL